ncbi:MAG TPA: helix-turn-helix domain-containing protein [Thermoanaerobaculia bacterium]|nr:helix-turn-helix domain-containing protein [Thermoanaerobaculia bacterium]
MPGGITKLRKHKLISRLEELGLSSYEAQAYLASLRHAPLTGYQLSKASGVPRSRIYETIEKLSAKGLLMSQPGEKNLVTALDYRAFLDQKEKEASATIRFLREELAMLRTPEPSGIWTVSGREPILDLAAGLIGQARRYVYVAAVEADLLLLAEALPKERTSRAPILGVYCGDGEVPIEGIVRHLGPDCSRGSEIAIVVDGERALVGCTQPEETATAALTPNSGVVSITEQYIKHELFLNSLYATKDKVEIQAYIRQYDRTMRKLP